MKVRIKQLPKKAYGGQQAGGALNVTPAKWGGAENNAKEGKEVKQSLTKVPRSMANLEAEGGETAFGPISGDTIPDHFKIAGPRHHSGGVPLNLPDDTFIFSDTKAMRITDPGILKMFNKTSKKGGYTPADLAKPYDINKYKAILMDPESDKKSRDTATLMIKNYIIKLGALALAQESKKGFPQGIPEMARPYMEANDITDKDLIPQEEGSQEQEPMMKTGGITKFAGGGSPDDGDPINLKQLNRITIDGSLGKGQASILKDGKSITAKSGFIKITGVQAKGDGIEIITNVGNQSLGEFKKQNDGSYKFVPNQSIYKQFLQKSTADDKVIFGSFVQAIESNDNFRNDVQSAITGTNKYEPKTNSKEYFSPGKTPKPTPVPNAVPGESKIEPVPNATPGQGTVVNADNKRAVKPVFTKLPNTSTNTSSPEEDDKANYNKYLEDQAKAKAIAEYNRYKNPGGTLMAVVPNPNDPIYQEILKRNRADLGLDQSSNQVDPRVQGNNAATSDYIPNLSNEQNSFLQSLPADQRQLYMNMMNNQGATWMNDSSNFSRQNFRGPNESKFGWSPRNPFSLKSYTPEFNWLSPMGAGRMTRPGIDGSMPISGFPTGQTPTSIDYDLEVNPWLKALFNKDIARRSLHTRFNFNEDLSKFTDDAEEISNEEFAKKQFPENDKFGRKNRKELETILNKGSLTQEEYLASQQTVEDSEVVENKAAAKGESDSPVMNYVPSEVDPTDPNNMDLDNNAGLDEIADAQGASQQDPALSDQQIYQMMEGEQGWVDENGKRRSFDPNRPITQDQWQKDNAGQKIAMDNIYQNILDASADEQAELMAIDGITRKDLQEYKTMGPAYAADSRNDRIDFQNDVDAGMYKEAVEALGAGANSSEIMEWQSDYNSEQRSKIKFEDNKKRFGGTHSGLDKFVLGGFDPSLALREGTMQGANKQEREQNYFDDLIYNEDNLDNLTQDQLTDRNTQLLANDPVSQMEFDPGMPPPPPNVGQDGNDQFSYETDQKINTAGKFSPEISRQQAGYVANLGTKAGEAAQDWKNRGSFVNKLFKKSQNANVSQAVNMGDEYANTQGQIAPGSQSRSELMRTMGTTLGRYGGSMSEYGAEMGGAYYPTMSTGGTRRVKITGLPGSYSGTPQFDTGGVPNHPHEPDGSHPSSPGQTPPYYSMTGAEDQAAEAGYKLQYRPDDYRFKNIGSGVGKQTGAGGWNVDATTGLYYNDAKGQVNPGMTGLDAIGTDWEGAISNPFKEYSSTTDPNVTGFEGWKKDYLAGTKGKSSDATRWYVDNINKVYTDAGLDPVIDKSKQGYDIFGTELYNAPALILDEEEQVVEEETTPEITPEETTPEETPVVEKVPNASGGQDCVCRDAQGKEISRTPEPTDGSPCPPCKATIRGRKKQQDDPYEIPRRTDQHYRNMSSINRYKLPNMRVNPPQVANRETVPTLTNFHTGDITSQQNALQRSNNAYAGNSQQAFAKNLAVMSKGLPMTGKRAQDKSTENALKVGKSGQINAQLGQRGDQLNASLLASAGQLNARFQGDNIKASNAKLANLNLEDQRGQNEMEQAMMYNYKNPNHQIGYSDHAPWFRKSYRDSTLDPNLVASNTTPKTKNQAKNTKKPNSSKYGGPVKSNTFIPRYTTMPYGN